MSPPNPEEVEEEVIAGSVKADPVVLEEPDAEEDDLVFCVVCEPLEDETELVDPDCDVDCVAEEPELLVAGCVADEEPELLVADDAAEEDCVNGGRLLFCAATL